MAWFAAACSTRCSSYSAAGSRGTVKTLRRREQRRRQTARTLACMQEVEAILLQVSTFWAAAQPYASEGAYAGTESGHDDSEGVIMVNTFWADAQLYASAHTPHVTKIPRVCVLGRTLATTAASATTRACTSRMSRTSARMRAGTSRM